VSSPSSSTSSSSSTAAPTAVPTGATALDSAVAAAAAAPAATGKAAATADAERWKFSMAPYLWLFDMDGSVSKHGKTVPVSIHLQDSVDLVQESLQIAFSGHMEATRGDWTFFLDGMLLAFEEESDAAGRVHDIPGVTTAEMDVSIDIRMYEAGVAWNAGGVDAGSGCCIPVELLGGVRWNELDVDMDIDVRNASIAFEEEYSPDFRTSWADAFVGARARIPIADSVSLQLRGDIGGGGFGDGSDVAWNVIAMLTFQVSDRMTAFAGWRWYDFEREVGGRDTELQLEGPGIGLLFRF
jgi:hypothetical protein